MFISKSKVEELISQAFEQIRSKESSREKNLLDTIKSIEEKIAALSSYHGLVLKEVERNFNKQIADQEAAQTEKYLKVIERLFNFTKDTMMLAVISKSGDSSLAGLKRDLMMPEIKKNWQESEKKSADALTKAVISNGEKILHTKIDLENKLLEYQRTGKPTDVIKGQLDIINMLEVNKNGKV